MNVMESAKELHIHRNTLLYRIHQIEEMCALEKNQHSFFRTDPLIYKNQSVASFRLLVKIKIKFCFHEDSKKIAQKLGGKIHPFSERFFKGGNKNYLSLAAYLT
jgi:hypothetical protein